MTLQELQDIIDIDESYRIERTVSTSNMDKFQEAICAFANDLPGKRQKGYLLIGVDDNGKVSGLKVDDALMKKISGIRSDGNILPLPVMNTEKVSTPDGDVLVVEVTPSFDTPVRYCGRTFVRIGPRRDIASAEEERILTERCAAALPGFDTRPCREATLSDLYLDVIQNEYLPLAISQDILSKDSRDGHKTYEESISSIRLNSAISETLQCLNQLEPKHKQHIISLIMSMESQTLSTSEIKLKPELKPEFGNKSNAFIMKEAIAPAIKLGLIARTYPENPRHPKQQYYLTELGRVFTNHLQTGEML